MGRLETSGARVKPPFRYDIVGSFLRPQAIKDAREKFEKGEIDAKTLKEIEDREIAALVQREKAAGLKAVTDGEFRRGWWHLDFLWNLSGVKRVEAEHYSVQFHGKDTKAVTLEVTGKVDFPETHPFLEHFKFMQQAADGALVKFTIPSPSMLHLITAVRTADYQPIERYRDNDLYLRDIAAAYQKAIAAFYAAGCRYLQLDDTSWGEFCSEEKRAAYKARGLDLDKIARDYVNMVNEAISEKPADMTITMHICRGNFRSTWFSSGGYEPVAETLFGNCRVDGFFLEYDSNRAGDFKPLRFVKNQQVVLGLVTSKAGKLEDKDAVIARIEEAAEIISPDQLCLSPQCGFASTEEGNILTEEEQWNKIALIKEIAEEVW